MLAQTLMTVTTPLLRNFSLAQTDILALVLDPDSEAAQIDLGRATTLIRSVVNATGRKLRGNSDLGLPKPLQKCDLTYNETAPLVIAGSVLKSENEFSQIMSRLRCFGLMIPNQPSLRFARRCQQAINVRKLRRYPANRDRGGECANCQLRIVSSAEADEHGVMGNFP